MVASADTDTIVRELRAMENIERVILFGSAARGADTIDSDIDLVVVLRDRGFHATYRDIVRGRVAVARRLMPVLEHRPVDVLVYTSDEWAMLHERGSDFARTVEETGTRLI